MLFLLVLFIPVLPCCGREGSAHVRMHTTDSSLLCGKVSVDVKKHCLKTKCGVRGGGKEGLDEI